MRVTLWTLWRLWRISSWQPPYPLKAKFLVNADTGSVQVVLTATSGRTSTVPTPGPIDAELFRILDDLSDLLVWQEQAGETERMRRFERDFACCRRMKGKHS
jgi:hypothetical protein